MNINSMHISAHSVDTHTQHRSKPQRGISLVKTLALGALACLGHAGMAFARLDYTPGYNTTLTGNSLTTSRMIAQGKTPSWLNTMPDAAAVASQGLANTVGSTDIKFHSLDQPSYVDLAKKTLFDKDLGKEVYEAALNAVMNDSANTVATDLFHSGLEYLYPDEILETIQKLISAMKANCSKSSMLIALNRPSFREQMTTHPSPEVKKAMDDFGSIILNCILRKETPGHSQILPPAWQALADKYAAGQCEGFSKERLRETLTSNYYLAALSQGFTRLVESKIVLKDINMMTRCMRDVSELFAHLVGKEIFDTTVDKLQAGQGNEMTYDVFVNGLQLLNVDRQKKILKRFNCNLHSQLFKALYLTTPILKNTGRCYDWKRRIVYLSFYKHILMGAALALVPSVLYYSYIRPRLPQEQLRQYDRALTAILLFGSYLYGANTFHPYTS